MFPLPVRCTQSIWESKKPPAPQTGTDSFFISGGNYRARTYDPLLVRQMLSQLS